jgi:hypothetical protein
MHNRKNSLEQQGSDQLASLLREVKGQSPNQGHSPIRRSTLRRGRAIASHQAAEPNLTAAGWLRQAALLRKEESSHAEETTSK